MKLRRNRNRHGFEYLVHFDINLLEGLYRNELNIQSHVYFYYALISSINENIVSEKESKKLELEALEYHIRAMATPKGIIELEKHLKTTHL
jgi:hypothetical protein